MRSLYRGRAACAARARGQSRTRPAARPGRGQSLHMPTMALLLPLIVCWAKIASTSAEHEDTAVTVTVSVGASSPGRPLPHYTTDENAARAVIVTMPPDSAVVLDFSGGGGGGGGNSDSSDDGSELLSWLKSDDEASSQQTSTSISFFPGLAVSFSTGPGAWNNVTYSRSEFKSSGGASSEGPWTLDSPDIHAVITQRKDGRFDLAFTPKTHAVPRVSFPFLTGVPSMDDEPNMYAMFPMLGGIYVKNGADGYSSMQNDEIMSYPGSFHSPYVMLATRDAAVMAAATTWPPHHVHPKRRMKANATGAQPLQIDWTDGYAAGKETSISIILSEYKTDTSTQTAGWQAAILAYRSWLVANRPPPAPPAANNKAAYSEGTYAMGLMNMATYNLTAIDREFRQWSDVLGRATFWGQMSTYAGPAKFCHPPRLPGEVVSCCALNQSMHPRYLGSFSPNGSLIVPSGCGSDPTNPPAWTPGSQCLPAWAKHIAQEGYEVGYYTRNDDQYGEVADNATWLKSWLGKMSALGGNAQYVDVFARTYNGKPSEVLKMIEQGAPPNDVITEGWNDLYPFAGLLSGYHQADDWCSCCSPLINASAAGAPPGKESYFGQCCNTTIYGEPIHSHPSELLTLESD
jgi:hypothetical protein